MTKEKLALEIYFLSSDLHNFYLNIQLHDYRFQKLSEEQQENVLDYFEILERKLLETYGENASFELYFNDEHQAEYVKGVRK